MGIFIGCWLLYCVWQGGEFLHDVPDLNDDVLHLDSITRAAEAFTLGQDPTDFWIPTITGGYPLFHHYQHGAQVVLGGLSAALNLEPRILLRGAQLLAGMLLPLVMIGCARGLGFTSGAACFCGVATILLASRGLYGMDPSSYGWAGPGLTTQQFGVLCLALALARLPRALEEGRGWVGAGVLVGATILTHTLLGYVAALTAVVWAVGVALARVPPFDGATWRRAGAPLARLGGVGVVAFLVSAYFVVPFWLDRHALNRSVWESAHKYDGYGAAWVMSRLLGGELADGGTIARLPWVSWSGIAGIVLAVFFSGRGQRDRLPLRRAAALCVGWLLLYFGRPTWGSALELLPMGTHLHLHRLIVPVQMALVLLAGGAMGRLFEAPGRLKTWVRSAVVLLTLLQPLWERHVFFALRRQWREDTAAQFAHQRSSLESVFASLARGEGRVYAGRATNWGQSYRVGAVPMYALLTARGVENVGYLYHALSRLAEFEGYMNEGRPAHLNLFNVTRILKPRENGEHHLLPVGGEGTFSWVSVVGDIDLQRESWRHQVIAWLESHAVEERRFFALSSGSSPRPHQSSPPPGMLSSCGSLTNEKSDSASWSVEVGPEVRCVLLAKVTYHPQLRAAVAGEPAPLFPLAPGFTGISLSPSQGGQKATLRLWYEPPPVRIGLRWGGWAMVWAFWAVSRVRSRCGLARAGVGTWSKKFESPLRTIIRFFGQG